MLNDRSAVDSADVCEQASTSEAFGAAVVFLLSFSLSLSPVELVCGFAKHFLGERIF